ncbi:hypothetical protein EVAR_90221_1 [Eumeta japonica]|uniref:Uncharacterized protein n=1 Tax=Eumeta variegata TaxID=151549 RepID=A0A4C1WYL2_EUMVA|nr:hypothetical protein EVAR_90221_1 [Eumeta japonica]
MLGPPHMPEWRCVNVTTVLSLNYYRRIRLKLPRERHGACDNNLTKVKNSSVDSSAVRIAQRHFPVRGQHT